MSVFDYEKVEVAESSVEVASVDDASSVGTIEGASPACAGRMMTVQVLVSVTPFRSVAFGEAARSTSLAGFSAILGSGASWRVADTECHR